MVFDIFVVVARVDQNPRSGHDLFVQGELVFEGLILAEEFLNGVIFRCELDVELVDSL